MLIIAGLLFAAGAALGAWLGAIVARWRYAAMHQRDIERARGEALEASRRVIRGLVTEQMAPFTTAFEFSPADARFIGNPVDFVVFEGLGEGDLHAVTLVEVKSGRSRLNGPQRAIREGVESGAVMLRWREVRLPDAPWPRPNRSA